MKEPTKVQQTIPLAEVPEWVMRQSERAFGVLKRANEELAYLIGQHGGDPAGATESLKHHIEQCRLALGDTDIILQDAHLTIAAFLNHLEEEQIEALKDDAEQMFKAAQAIKDSDIEPLKKEGKNE